MLMPKNSFLKDLIYIIIKIIDLVKLTSLSKIKVMSFL